MLNRVFAWYFHCLFYTRGWQLTWHASSALPGRIWASHHVPAPVLMGCPELHWGSMLCVRFFVAFEFSFRSKVCLEVYLIPVLFPFSQPFKSSSPVTMESLPVNNRNGQSYGYTLYETVITTGGLLKSGDNVRDRALVSLHRKWWHNPTLTIFSVYVRFLWAMLISGC